MKLSIALQFRDVYFDLLNTPLPLKISYKLNKIFSFLSPDFDFYDLKLKKILEEHAQRDPVGNFIPSEDGAGILIKENSLKACAEEIQELQDLEIQKPEIFFLLDEFPSTNITPKILQGLMPFIEE